MNERKYLVVVDMQNDFIDGSLGTPEAQKIVPAVVRRIEDAARDDYTIIATMDTHESDYLNTPEGRKLPVPHCIKGTRGWQIADSVLRAMPGCTVVEKPTFGCVKLPEVIGESPKEIEVIGLCTDICVVSNALLLKAFYPDTPIRVDSACCAGVTPEKHRAALETMASCQIDVL